MKRRDLFKMFATLATAAIASPLAALCRPKDAVDLSMSPAAMAAGHVKYRPGWIATGPTIPPKLFYIHSVEPTEDEKALGIIEKRVYRSTL